MLSGKANSTLDEDFSSKEEIEPTQASRRQSIFESEPGQSILGYFEKELGKCRAELRRLRGVEEECIYLRRTFLDHYRYRCPKTFKY